MARNFDEELEAIKADERKLADRRKAVVQKRSKQLAKTLEKSVLMQLEADRLDAFLKRVKALGIDEAERRLAA